MSRILAYRDTCLSELVTAFPAVTTIDTYAGKIDDAELAKMLVTAPALYLVFTGISATEARVAGGSLLTANFSIFIASSDTQTASREETAATLAEQLLVMLDRYQPVDANGAFLGRVASKLKFENLFSSDSSDTGQMLSAVSWETGITIAGAALPETFSDVVHGISEVTLIEDDAT